MKYRLQIVSKKWI